MGRERGSMFEQTIPACRSLHYCVATQARVPEPTLQLKKRPERRTSTRTYYPQKCFQIAYRLAEAMGPRISPNSKWRPKRPEFF